MTGAADLGLDHVVIVVGSLASAAAAFGRAGFVVRPGGRHDALPTENALVAFADGSYLELLACREPEARAGIQALARTPRWERHVRNASAIARRFLPALAGEDGVADWALRRARLARFAAESRRRGVAMTGPVPMRRERPDGVALAWELLLPEARALPFLIEDRTGRSLRVPADADAVRHANGARGVAVVRVRAAGHASQALALADLFGVAPSASAEGVAGLALGAARVTVEPGAPDGACGVALLGVGALPAEIEALGVRGAGG